eukprot:scaffold124660_cov21-Tisochrysis_lutea.AAC.1
MARRLKTDWRVPYRLEVLKGGAIVEAQDVSCKDHYTFGRTPGCDFVLEHPSASRLHAVSGDSVCVTVKKGAKLACSLLYRGSMICFFVQSAFVFM